MNALDQRLVEVVPSQRQQRLQDMEFYAFIHFTVNTFTDREWGDGTEDPALFNPDELNADQWVESVKAAGMKGLILTCKHHDGFCLWPSRYTSHSVASSPWRNGQGDVVAEVADACRRGGIGFGIYLSPWDRNQPLYGSGRPYDDTFIAQLTELLTGYGDIFAVWFDGACGEGPNGKKQFYDWPRYYETIRRLQPGACISVCGPDVRWCGNEAGDTRTSEWSVVPARTRDTEKVASMSQQSDDVAFRQRKISASDQDLGSREILRDEMDLIWYPAEVNTSIRPGWFWHASEDDQVKPLEKLIDIYEKSVGGNATMLLNIPPTSRGLLHANDVTRLREFGGYLQNAYGTNLVDESAQITVDDKPCECLKQDDDGFCRGDGPKMDIVIRWEKARSIRRVVMKEQLAFSQRVERCAVDIWRNDGWLEIWQGTVIGHKRIAAFEQVTTTAVRIRILDSRVAPVMRFVGAYA